MGEPREAVENVFCTILDVNFLTRGLVLYRSLEAVSDRFLLRVFCADDHSLRLLERLRLPDLEAISLSTLEAYDPELAGVRGTRALDEYCWTAKPAMCLHTLEQLPATRRVTYVDADLMFWRDPGLLFAELSEGSVLLVPHNAALVRRCTYNAGFIGFRNDANALQALRWWRERCLEWCYDRTEDGKHGDQGYLDEFPKLFAGVHALRHPGGIVAPWNAHSYDLAQADGKVTVDGEPLVFYHYQSLRLLRDSALLCRLARHVTGFRRLADPLPLVWTLYAGYNLSPEHVALVWEPYVRNLSEEIRRVRELEPGFAAGFNRGDVRGIALEVARQVVPDRVKKAALAADTWWRSRLLGDRARSQPRHFFG